jgi:hypothetical protein
MKCMTSSCSNELSEDAIIELCDECLDKMAKHYEQLVAFDMQDSEEERAIATHVVDNWINQFM